MQYHIPGVPQANFAKTATNASEWLPHGRATPSSVLDGVQLYMLSGSSSLENVIALEFDMATMPTLQNQLTYFGLRTTAPAGALRLAIDRGDGKWQYGRHLPGQLYHPPKPDTMAVWHQESFAQVLQSTGIARFALASNESVDVGQLVVARVGAAWADVVFK